MEKLLKALKAAKIKVKKVYLSDWPEIEDDMITIDKSWYIKVDRTMGIWDMARSTDDGKRIMLFPPMSIKMAIEILKSRNNCR